LQAAIDFSQALAAWNCGFLGARGGMYAVSKGEFQRTIRQILEQRSHSMPADDGPQGASGKIIARVCSECRDSKKPGSSRALARLMHE
jgi:hypothetical protein